MLRLPRPAALAIVGALVLAGCATDDVDEAATTTTDVAPSPTASPPTTSPTPPSPAPPSPTVTATTTAGQDAPGPAGGVPSLATRCELPAEGTPADRVQFATPRGWQVEEGTCRFLDPSLERLPAEAEPDTAVTVTVSEQDFSTVARTDEIDGEVRWVGARSGYQAVRVRGEATGQGLRPAGEPVQLWLVDLDAGTDDGGGTLVIAARPSDGASFDLAAEAADRIAGTLRVVPPAADASPVVVSRVEGGGQPWTVTFDPEAGCFHLRPGGPTDDAVDQACDVATPEDMVTGAILDDGDQQVVVGLAPPRATVVESDAATAPYGGVTTSLEGAAAFAYRAPAVPTEVRAIDAAGGAVGTGTIG